MTTIHNSFCSNEEDDLPEWIKIVYGFLHTPKDDMILDEEEF